MTDWSFKGINGYALWLDDVYPITFNCGWIRNYGTRTQPSMGITGLFNIGVAGFFAIGGYASAIATTKLSPNHLSGLIPFFTELFFYFSGLMAAIIGKYYLRGDYLIATIGLAEIHVLS